MVALTFKFIAGKYEGGEFIIPEAGEFFIGRSVEVAICLVEDLVSRRHAKLIRDKDTLTLEDLNSTNGTFVNGERIAKCTLVLGDRLLVGTSIMRLEAPGALASQSSNLSASSSSQESIADHPTRVTDAPLPPEPTQTEDRPSTSVHPSGAAQAALATPVGPELLQGELGDVGIAEVMRLIQQARHTGLLQIGGAKSWALTFSEGTLTDACSVAVPSMPASKALARVVQEQQGHFQLHAQPSHKDARLVGTTENLVLDATRANDENLRLCQSHALAQDSILSFSQPPGRKLSGLAPHLLDTLQMAIEHSTVGETLDHCEAEDSVVLAHIIELIGQGFLSL